jgi:KUP system potassium uptake protein
VVLGGGAALLFESLFFAANLTKLVSGAWLPLLIGLTLFTVMDTWRRGRRLVSAHREEMEGSLRDFVEQLDEGRFPVQRVPGTAIFLNRGGQTAPLALRANVERNRVLHERIVIVSVEILPVPQVPPAEATTVEDLGRSDDAISLVTVRFGYMQRTDVPGVLARLPPDALEAPLDLDHASYFLSIVDLHEEQRSQLPRWRTRLFVAMASARADAATAFELPVDRTVLVGSRLGV